MIRAVVFDLDGTLADTANLGDGKREPRQVIDSGVDALGRNLGSRDWSWGKDVSDIPARLIERGYWVGIATRAPLAYSSTLLHLIGCDYQTLRFSCGPGLAKASVIRDLAKSFKLREDELLYCGDLPEDRQIAENAGVHFLEASQLRKENILERFPQLRPMGNGEKTGMSSSGPCGSAAEYFLLFKYLSSIKRNELADADLDLISNYLELCETRPVQSSNDVVSGQTVSSWRAAMSYILLTEFPSLPQRRRLQLELFQNLSECDRDFVLSSGVNRFGMEPRIVTRRELRDDEDLRLEYFEALKRVWPGLSSHVIEGLSVVANYHGDGVFGKVLGGAKDYKKHPWCKDGRYRSGPQVKLDDLGFVADLVASRIPRTDGHPLVPIPASAFSDRQPGQFSTRLARRVSDLLGKPLVPLVRRNGDDYVVDQSIRESMTTTSVDLLDDQVTTGQSIQECRSVLAALGISIRHIYGFSANTRVLANFTRPTSVSPYDQFQAILEHHWGH